MVNRSFKKHPAGSLIISHDRTLLNEVDHIYHLNEHGLHHTTGNYEKILWAVSNQYCSSRAIYSTEPNVKLST